MAAETHALYELVEEISKLAEQYDRVLNAMVAVARDRDGDEAAVRCRAAIELGKRRGVEELQAYVQRQHAQT